MFAAIALTVALGVGATDSNTIVVRIDGKETPVTLAGVNAGSERGAAFVKCLVAGRVVRIKGPRTAATATLLDDTSVGAHVNEFLQTGTATDPCAIGRAAYQGAPKTVPAPPVQRKSSSAAPAKKPVREVHVAFSSGNSSKDAYNVPRPATSRNEWGVVRPPAPAAAPQPFLDHQSVYATPPAAGVSKPEQAPAPIYAPPTATTSTAFPQAEVQQTLQQQSSQPALVQSTSGAPPTTTYAPKPPL